MGRYLLQRNTLLVPPDLAPIVAAWLERSRRDPSMRLVGPMADHMREWLEDLDELAGTRRFVPSDPGRWITTSEAAQLLGVTDRYVRTLADARKLRSVRDDRGRWLLAEADVLEERDARDAA